MFNNGKIDIFDTESLMESVITSGNDSLGIENPEHDILIAEAFIMEALSPEELIELKENSQEMQALINDDILSEASIIRFDKNAKRKRAEMQAVLAIAREKKDRDFNKLIRVWKMRKMLLNNLYNRHIGAAKSRALVMLRNLGKSKSPVAKKVAMKTKEK